MKKSESDEEPAYFQYKIVVIGNGTVGKTSLIMRFVDDYFGKSYKQTIGVDFFVKRLQLSPKVQVALQVWDIGGQSIFGKMINTYIKDSHAVVMVYDITNFQSFADLPDWINLVQKAFTGKKMPILALVGNKTDLFHMQAVDLAAHKDLATEHKMHSFFASAKTGDQVSLIFHKLAALLSGVEFKKEVVQLAQTVVKAEIVNYERNDTSQPKAEDKLKEKEEKAEEGGCNLL